MPWFPMIEGQKALEETSENRIAFLQAFIKEAPTLFPPSTNSDKKIPQPSFLPAIASLMHLAELAFLTNRTSVGIDALHRMYDSVVGVAPAYWPLLRLAVVGTILGRLQVYLNTRSFSVRIAGMGPSDNGGSLHIEDAVWSSSPSMLRQSAPLLLACAFSGGRPAIEFSEQQPDTPISLAKLTIEEIPIWELRPLFSGVSDSVLELIGEKPVGAEVYDRAWYAYRQVHAIAWTNAQRLQQDQYHWRRLRLKKSILDWPLLLTHIALRRHGSVARPTSPRLMVPTTNLVARYLDELSSEIDGALRGGRS